MPKFPKNFFWGTATSSHQIEGDNTNNDWWEAEQGASRRPALLKHKSGKACDSYNRYEEDFDLAKTMGNNAHRFSIEWSRIEPEEGKFNEAEIEHYRKVLRVLRARGLEPFVTLHHFTNPIWFARKGGWTNKKAPEYFERYVRCVAERLLGEVKYWITINEPVIVSRGGYIKGDWPPFKKRNFVGYFRALANMAEAHKRAYAALHQIGINSPHSPPSYSKRGGDGGELASVQVGVATSVNYFEPQGEGLLLLLDYFRVFLSRYFKNESFLNKISKYQDFIGLNYYKSYKVSFLWGRKKRGLATSDFGWEIYPQGLYQVVKEIYKKYKKPIFITENGVSDADDDQRPEFIKNHLKWLHKAIEEGVDVRGYFYWSLLDNFEWAEGFTQRFGLVEVDFNTFERKMRPSGRLYGEICKNNGAAE
jgi:beta-glucosidase